jgi:hypothetical protein
MPWANENRTHQAIWHSKSVPSQAKFLYASTMRHQFRPTRLLLFWILQHNNSDAFVAQRRGFTLSKIGGRGPVDSPSSKSQSTTTTTTTALNGWFGGINVFGGKPRSQDYGTQYLPIDLSSLQTDAITCDPDFPCTDDDSDPDVDQYLFFQDFWMVIGIPILTPFVAFFTFEKISKAYQGVVEFLSTKTWVAVDGGGMLFINIRWLYLAHSNLHIFPMIRTSKQVVDANCEWSGGSSRGSLVCDSYVHDHYNPPSASSRNSSRHQYGSG